MKDSWRNGGCTCWRSVRGQHDQPNHTELAENNSKLSMELLKNEEEDLAEDSDRMDWGFFCRKYEQLFEDFCLEEVFMKDENLYAKSTMNATVYNHSQINE